MLTAVVFDMGNVLIRFDPEYFVHRIGASGEDYDLLLNQVFRSPEWPMLDAGRLAEEDVYKIVQKRLPERLHAAARKLTFSWDDPIEPIPGMEALVRWAKVQGLKIYLLSNASVRQKDYWENIPAHEIFDGRLISAEHLVMKPDPEIFNLLMRLYGLKAEECLFVDDVRPNVDAAVSVGMQGFLFTGDAQALQDEIKKLMA